MRSRQIVPKVAASPEELSEGEVLGELVTQVTEYDLRLPPSENRDHEIARRIRCLSRRERQVMRLLYEGNTMKRIAAELGIKHQTVAKHRTSMLEKMEVDGEADLARLLTVYALQESRDQDSPVRTCQHRA